MSHWVRSAVACVWDRARPIGVLAATVWLTACLASASAETIRVRVATGADDAEELLSDNSVDLTSSDLELVEEGAGNFQSVGIRFANVPLPRGAAIRSASIQFTADDDDTDSGATSVAISGELSPNAAPFSASAGDVTSRPLTDSFAEWNNIPAWNTPSEVGPNQRTPDLVAVVQEIVNQSGWADGNAMSFIIDGSGERTAESADGSARGDAPFPAAPLLIVTFDRVVATVDSSPSVPLTIPAGCNDGQSVTYQLQSSDDNVAAPAAPGTITFGAGADRTARFDLNVVGVGSATITVTPMPGSPAACIDLESVAISVHGIDALDLQLSLDTLELGKTAPQPARVVGNYGPAGERDISAAATGTTYAAVPSGIVDISADGVITPLLPGSVEITATNGSATETESLEVIRIRGKTFETRADDDTEERANGTLDFTSSDLELGDSQLVGIHWSGIDIPQGAAILVAEMVFSADEDDDAPGTDFTIAGELSPDADIFENENFNISSRPMTMATVRWFDVPPWTSDDVANRIADERHTTPDLSSIIQEIVNQPGWVRGNAMVLTVDARAGGAKRVAESRDSGALTAVLLRIIWSPQEGFTPDPIVAATIDPPLTSELTIPSDCNLADDVTYSINSGDSGITAASAPGAVTFNARSAFFQNFNIEFPGGDGTTTVTASAPDGSPEACTDLAVEVTVHPIDAVTLDLAFSISTLEVGDTVQARVTGSYGPAGERDITNGPAGTTYDATPPGIVDVSPDGLITALAAGTVDITANNGVADTTSVTVAEQVTKIAFLAGGLRLNTGDAAAVDHLRSLTFTGDPGQIDAGGLVPQVTTFVGDNFNVFDEDELAANFDLLIVSDTFDTGIVEARLRCTNVPLVFWEPGLAVMNRQGLANGGGSVAPLEDCSDGIFITDTDHPITQGLAAQACLSVSTVVGGQLNVVNTGTMSAGRLAGGGRVLAEVGIDEGAIVVAGPADDPDIPGGDGLRLDGLGVFLSRHVFLWLSEDSFVTLTPAGLTLFENAVDWALGGTRGSPAATGLEVSSLRNQLCPADGSSAAGSSTTQLRVNSVGGLGTCAADLTSSATGTIYSVAPEGIVSVSPDGLVTALAAGNTQVTATNGGLSASLDFEVSAIDAVSGFRFESWSRPGGIGNGVVENVQLTQTEAPLEETVVPVVNFASGGCGSNITPDGDYPGIGATGTSNFTVRATGFLLFESTDPVWLRVNSDDGFFLSIDDEVVLFFDGGRGCGDSDITDYRPPRAGLLAFELIHWQGGSGAGVEFVQILNGDPSDQALINDPVDTRTLRVFQSGCPDAPVVAPGPELVRIMGGLGSAPDTFISPLGEDVAFDTVDLDLSAEATLVSGPGMTLTSNGGGNHTLTLDTPVAPGACRTLSFDVADAATGGVGSVAITLCHLPLDVNQDGEVTIGDITAWGNEFNGGRRTSLVDTNGDGSVNVQDATTVGNNWFGRPPATRPWFGESLP